MFASLHQQIADYNQIVTPRANAAAISERLQELRSQRPALQLRLIQVQRAYTNQAPQLYNVQQQLLNLDKHIHILQQKYLAVHKEQA